MLPPPQKPATLQSAVEGLVAWAQDEMSNPGKRAASIKILRAFAIFTAGVVISRSYGEYLFVG
jgi:hypothetical protein